ncbi:hypothetical protein Q8A67_016829 [Cirrhinus molitorella]|uniref:Uncharacterized protein n=1 Tax=Cirrhinus molitorella TaxID=172907 RepID=A0AA88TJI8_9TELE|nr:hypothetical protein Q8A67_016829 [Cirrhinus molitorella]
MCCCNHHPVSEATTISWAAHTTSKALDTLSCPMATITVASRSSLAILTTTRALERHQSVNDIETFEEDEEEGHSFSDQNTGEPSNSGFGALQDHDYLATSPSTEEQLNAAQKEIV